MTIPTSTDHLQSLDDERWMSSSPETLSASWVSITDRTALMLPTSPSSSGFACAYPSCDVCSIRSCYESMTLRMCFPRCTRHFDMQDAQACMSNVTDELVEQVTIIFVDIEVSAGGDEISQIGAVAEMGNVFSESLKVGGGAKGCNYINTLSGKQQKSIRVGQSAGIRSFISWCRECHCKRFGSGADDSKIILVAHNGALHDFRMLVVSMAARGIEIPSFSLCDSLVVAKTCQTQSTSCKLSSLVTMYTPWFPYRMHDAVEDARALMYVMRYMFKEWKKNIIGFACIMNHYLESIGSSKPKPQPAA